MNGLVRGLPNDDKRIRLHEADCKQIPLPFSGRFPFIQVFEFVPILGYFRGMLEELKLIFVPESKNKLEIIIKIDQKGVGVEKVNRKSFDTDETEACFIITTEEIPHLILKVKSEIGRLC